MRIQSVVALLTAILAAVAAYVRRSSRGNCPVRSGHWAFPVRKVAALAAIVGILASCASVRPPVQATNKAPETIAAASGHPAPTLIGQVSFESGRSVAATMGDVASGATVSFLDFEGNTVATALSDPAGHFALPLPQSFYPQQGVPYVLEAIKGLGTNQPGRTAARVRTLISFTGEGWASLTNAAPGNVQLDSGTTAIAIGAALLNLQYGPFIGSLAIGTPDTYSPPENSPLTVAHFDTLVGLVKNTLAGDQDPVAAIGYDAVAGKFVRVHTGLAVTGQSAVRVAPGDSLTLTGRGFDPTIANDSVMFGLTPGTVTSASATQIVVTVPAFASTGPLVVRVNGLSAIGPTVGVVDGTVSTLAGGLFNDGAGLAAKFVGPCGMAMDGAGTVYVAETNNNRIRKVTAAGVVSTLAGGGAGYADGTGAAAQFYWPRGVVVDGAGTVYVADTANHRIRKVTAGGVVSTLAGSGTAGYADGTGTAAQFDSPYGVAVDGAGTVYVADLNNHRIRKVTAAGVVSTLAGSGTAGYADGTGAAAQFDSPYGMTVDGAGTVYVADTGSHRIRKVTAAGVVSTLAGSTQGYADGTGAAAQFYSPEGVAIDGAGSVFVTDAYNHRIRKVTAAGVVSTLAGSTQGYADGTGTAAQFNYPFGVAVDGAGTVHVTDTGNNRIRKVTAAGEVSTLAGSWAAGYADGTGTSAQFNNPSAVAVDGAGTVYVGDRSNHRIRKVTAAGVVSTLAGNGQGYADGTGTAAQFNSPGGVAVDGAGTVYVADTSNHRIRKVTAAGVASTLAGSTSGYADGTGAAAQFNNPSGVAVDEAGNVYVADWENHRIRKVTPGGAVTTLAGSGTIGWADGNGTAAEFTHPSGVAVDSAGNVYVADVNGFRIRKVAPGGAVTTVAGSGTPGWADGTGTAAQFTHPRGVTVDGAGNLYVADSSNHRIRKVTAAGVVSTLAGSTSGHADGTGTAAQFYLPYGVAVDGAGTVYVADTYNHGVRAIR